MLKEYFDSISSNQLTIIVLTLSMVVGGTAALAVYEINPGHQESSFMIEGWVEDPDGDNASVGFDVGEGMNYGEMIMGTNVTKSLNLDTVDRPTYVQIETGGNMSEGLQYEPKRFEEEDFSIDFKYVTEKANHTGYVQGNIELDIRTADNRWEELWLKTLYSLP